MRPTHYRICSCGAKLHGRGAIRGHQKKGHHVPMKHYKVDDGEK